MTQLSSTSLLPTQLCRGCGREYQVAWVFLVPDDEVIIDLCGGCARRLRCSSGENRRRIPDEKITAGRRDA
jgi:hypothetical protein